MEDNLNRAEKKFSEILLRDQKGQAIFELLIFIPFLIFLYSIYYTVGNSISASINQQKAVRGYFYALTKGNSYLNTLSDLRDFADQNGIKTVGFSAVGWREQEKSKKQSVAPCFKFSSLLKSDSNEECENGERPEEKSSRFIRIFTFYGVCGPVYTATEDPLGQVTFTMPPENQGQWDKCALIE